MSNAPPTAIVSSSPAWPGLPRPASRRERERGGDRVTGAALGVHRQGRLAQRRPGAHDQHQQHEQPEDRDREGDQRGLLQRQQPLRRWRGSSSITATAAAHVPGAPDGAAQPQPAPVCRRGRRGARRARGPAGRRASRGRRGTNGRWRRAGGPARGGRSRGSLGITRHSRRAARGGRGRRMRQRRVGETSWTDSTMRTSDARSSRPGCAASSCRA